MIKTKIPGSIMRYRDYSLVKAKLSAIKLVKLGERHEKYNGSEATVKDILCHLAGEFTELRDALEDPARDRRAIYRELADCSNCVDILFYMLEKTPDLSQPHSITPD